MATVTFAVGTADTGATPNTTDAFSPASGDFLVVAAACGGTVDAAPTCTNSTGLGMLYVPSSQQVFSGGGQSLYYFVSDAAVSNTASQTITVETAGDLATGSVLFVYRVSGMSKFGTDAVRQFKGTFATAATTPNTVFDTSALTDNPTICIMACSTNPPAVTPPTNWTEDASGDLGYETPTFGAESCFRNSGFTGTTITWGSDSTTAWGALSIELDASAVAGVTKSTKNRLMMGVG